MYRHPLVRRLLPVLLLTVLAAFIWYEGTKGWTPEEVGWQVKAALPRGSMRTEVQEWLDSQAFPSGSSAPSRGPWLPSAAGVDPDQVSGAISAQVPSPNVNWRSQEARIAITFFFDNEGRLLGHVVVVGSTMGRGWPWNWLRPLWWVLICLSIVLCARVLFQAWQKVNKGRFSTRRLLVGLLLLACVGALILLVSSELKRRGPFWDKYQKVQLGMTKRAVEDILGPPTDEEQLGGIGAPTICVWVNGDQRIGVSYQPLGPKGEMIATRRGFLPLPIWEKVRRLALGVGNDWP
jgi:hypothetical protein